MFVTVCSLLFAPASSRLEQDLLSSADLQGVMTSFAVIARPCPLLREWSHLELRHPPLSLHDVSVAHWTSSRDHLMIHTWPHEDAWSGFIMFYFSIFLNIIHNPDNPYDIPSYYPMSDKPSLMGCVLLNLLVDSKVPCWHHCYSRCSIYYHIILLFWQGSEGSNMCNQAALQYHAPQTLHLQPTLSSWFWVCQKESARPGDVCTKFNFAQVWSWCSMPEPECWCRRGVSLP